MLLWDEEFAISSNLGKSLQKIRKFLVKEFKIPLLMTPVQEKETLITPLKDNQKFPLQKNIRKMLETIKRVSQHQGQHNQNKFLSNLYLVKKSVRRYLSVLNLKALNQFVPLCTSTWKVSRS